MNNQEVMRTPFELGKIGENIAITYLKKEGYKILTRNWFYDHKEIDIIARQGDEIVIVEVKTRDGDYFEEPWESVTSKKIRKIIEVADAWLIQKGIDLETRFDIISIIFSDEDHYTLTHFPEAFTPPVN
jgi:putative endonuclease